ncbi:hypothetical protein F5884DRAFT_688547 [Xylogone sp. PMI_703]|nr:hypothetical protein F5884DRAFT_688547 [Xylogone sp. PMI_703]
MKNIVILGASYAGITTAHGILKHSSKAGPVKVTLVSPNTHHYGNMASARSIIPGQFDDERLFQVIAPGFAKYTNSQFEFIIGSAESLNLEAKNVRVSSDTGHVTLEYDFLVLATGSRTTEPTPFKGLGSTETTKVALHDFQSQVKNAKMIVVAGAGVTGVEVAGELGCEYGQSKKIILVSTTPKILPQSPEFVSRIATTSLLKLHVSIRYQTHVVSSSLAPDGRHILTLSDGECLSTDMYIPTFGLTPNSSYIPSKLLNSDGFVEVDEYLRVKGAKDVWAIGDVSALEVKQYLASRAQALYLSKAFTSILRNKLPTPYKISTRPIGLQIGKKVVVGHFGGWRMPTFVIAMSRKNLFTEYLKPLVDGSLSSWL